MKVKKITLSELKNLVKKTIKEESYSDYLDTHFSSDGMDDYYSDKTLYSKIEILYNAGKAVYDAGETDLGNMIRNRALKLARSSDWGEDELPMYEGVFKRSKKSNNLKVENQPKPKEAPQPGTNPTTVPTPAPDEERRRRITPRPGVKPRPKAKNETISKIVKRYKNLKDR